MPTVSRGPLSHHVALEGRILAALREANAALTARAVAEAVGTSACGCCTNPAAAANHRAKPDRYGSCGGTGWRPTLDIDVRARMERLLRNDTVLKLALGGGRVAYYLAPDVEPEPLPDDDPWAGEPVEETIDRVINGRC